MPMLSCVLNLLQAPCWNANLGMNNFCMQGSTWRSIECH